VVAVEVHQIALVAVLAVLVVVEMEVTVLSLLQMEL
jgi:hypothetical protein